MTEGHAGGGVEAERSQRQRFRVRRTADDAVEGPPATYGWVRSGAAASTGGDTGTTNCDLWTSTIFGDSGTIAAPRAASGSTIQVGLWSVSQGSCFAGFGAWCIED